MKIKKQFTVEGNTWSATITKDTVRIHGYMLRTESELTHAELLRLAENVKRLQSQFGE